MVIISKDFEIKNNFGLLTPLINKAIFDKHLEEEKKREIRVAKEIAEGKRKYKSFSPSWIIDSCTRKCWYIKNGYPRPTINVELLKIFGTGNAIHDMVTNWLKDAGVLLGANFDIEDPETLLYGKPDGLIEIEKLPLVVEIKSMKNERFEDMLELDEPQLGHVKQLMLYMYMINKMIERGISHPILDKISVPITRGILYYVSKVWMDEQDGIQTLNFNAKIDKEFAVNYDQRVVDALLAKMKFLMETTILPERGFEMRSKECYFCDFKAECWNGGK